MKKLLTLLLLVPALAFVACSNDDKDLPKVDFDVTFENATNVDGTLYVVQGDTFEVASIEVRNLESTKGAYIPQAAFYWDYFYIGASIEPPFAFAVATQSTTPVGLHSLQINCPVYAVDKEPAFAVIEYKVQVVASADDIPESTDPAIVRGKPKITATGK